LEFEIYLKFGAWDLRFQILDLGLEIVDCGLRIEVGALRHYRDAVRLQTLRENRFVRS
jgi:hypothetical protein